MGTRDGGAISRGVRGDRTAPRAATPDSQNLAQEPQVGPMESYSVNRALPPAGNQESTHAQPWSGPNPLLFPGTSGSGPPWFGL